MLKILHLDENHELLKNELSNLGFENCFDFDSSKKEIENKLKKYHGIILRSRITIDKVFLDKGINLKFIARVGSGTENIDVVYANKKLIKIISAGEANANAVSEHALGMILSLKNRILKSNNEIKEGLWLREKNRGIEIKGKTVGIIGYGKTGKSFAEKLNALGANVLCNDIIPNKGDNYAMQVSINEIKEKSNIISLHTNLNETSLFLINNYFIDECKNPFYIINTSRGECLKTSDLVEGLKSGKILGACLDVIENESKSFEEINSNSDLDYLKNSKNVIITPHIAGWTYESKVNLSKVILKKIKHMFDL